MTTPTSPSPDATHVVSCFLLRRDRGSEEVLLAQRSQRVRTYRGAWAAISGYVEPGVTPLEQAYTEIREETALQHNDVELLRVGEPLPFTDATIGQAWVVHPFLFALAPGAPDRLRTDWEATTTQWIAPDAIASLPTVPMLAEAFARVYPADDEQHDAP